MRELSVTFMNDLLSPKGKLNPILLRVKYDQTLMLAIRDGFINIYYRGGNILKVTETKKGAYTAFFDTRYNISKQEIPESPRKITCQEDANKWVESFLIQKNIMDYYLAVNGNSEKEFQQLVARENNFSTISNESEYFISDIEVSDSISGARFDMMAIRWPATKRKSGENCRPAFIEMKFGDKAISGKAGLLKHLNDFDTFIADKTRYENLLRVIENQFIQLDQLELINFNKGKSFAKVKIGTAEKPEIIFILANHNPRGTGLKKILESKEFAEYGESQQFDLKFFVSSFAGYGLHTKCMLNLHDFLQLLQK